MEVPIDFEGLIITIKEARKILGISKEQMNDSQMAYLILTLQDMARELLQ